jgi:hypothetical protein
MRKINYEGKIFRATENVEGGDVDQDTVFYYHQNDDYLWAHYEGGEVSAGVLIGRVFDNSSIEFHYRHYDKGGVEKAGQCTSTPVEKDGQLYLYEKWYWTLGGEGQGTSIIKEINKD